MTATLTPRGRPRRLPQAGPALRRAPMQAVASPAVAASLATAVALLTLATAFRPLFVDSVGDAALRDELADFTAESLGGSVQLFGPLDADGFATADAALAAHTADTPLSDRVVELLVNEPGEVLHPDTGEPAAVDYAIGFEPVTSFQLLGRTGATDHLPEPRGGGEGLWIPQRLAHALGVGPGDELTFVQRAQQVEIPVAGTYRDLVEVLPTPAHTPPDALAENHPVVTYWHPRRNLVVGLSAQGDPIPEPPLLLGEPDALAALGSADFGPPTRMSWTYPFEAEGAGVRDTAEMQAVHERLERAAVDRTQPLGAALREAADMPGATVSFHSLLEGGVERPAALVATLDASLAPVTVGAQALAVLALLGAGVAATRRRHGEHAFLGAQGVGGLWFGGRALAESALPAAVGAATGAALAVALAAGLGPGGAPSAASLRAVVRGALLAMLAGGLLWALAAAAVRPAAGPGAAGRAARLARRVPWAVILVAAAAATAATLAGRDGGLLVGPEEARRLDPLAVTFPAVLVAAAAGVAARMVRPAGSWLGRSARHAPTALWLAARGVAAATGPARAALAATVVGVGLASFGVVAAASVEETVLAKAAAEGGGQTAVALTPRTPLPDLAIAHTEVFRTNGTANPAGREVGVLAVDPDTLGAAAVWRDAFADEPLDALLDALRAEGEALPVIAVGLSAHEVDRLRTDRYDIPVTVVAAPRAFPGMAGNDRILVADRERLVAAAEASGAALDEMFVLRRRRELWLDAGHQAAEPFVEGFYLGHQSVRGVEEIRERSDVRAAGWALGYLRAAGVVSAALALAALLAYAAARQRQSAAALALARRMGLSAREARTARAVELGGLGLCGALLGALAGVGAAWAIVAALDPLPGLPPEPILVVPASALGLTVLAVPALAAAGALFAARAGARRRPGALLRDG